MKEYTTKMIAEKTGMSKAAIMRHLKSGRIKSRRDTKQNRYLVSEEDLNEFLKEYSPRIRKTKKKVSTKSKVQTTDSKEDVIDKIVNRAIEPPKGMTIAELNGWLNGYAKCQLDIIDILKNS